MDCVRLMDRLPTLTSRKRGIVNIVINAKVSRQQILIHHDIDNMNILKRLNKYYDTGLI